MQTETLLLKSLSYFLLSPFSGRSYFRGKGCREQGSAFVSLISLWGCHRGRLCLNPHDICHFAIAFLPEGLRSPRRIFLFICLRGRWSTEAEGRGGGCCICSRLSPCRHFPGSLGATFALGAPGRDLWWQGRWGCSLPQSSPWGNRLCVCTWPVAPALWAGSVPCPLTTSALSFIYATSANQCQVLGFMLWVLLCKERSERMPSLMEPFLRGLYGD